MELTLVASTGDRFATFSPYVASVNEQGLVAFQAERTDGTHAVCVGEGRDLDEVAPEDVAAVTSHPDLNDRGDLSFYGVDGSGRPKVILVRDGVTSSFAGGFHSIGPAGPTMNEDGVVAFRGARVDGVPGVHAVEGGAVRTIAECDDTFGEFFGLPLVDEAGRVVFRADRRHGVQGVYREGAAGGVEPVVETGVQVSSIAPFPCWAADGGIAFAGTSAEGRDGVFLVEDGGV